MKIDLNTDMGEGGGPHRQGQAQEMIKHITSVNLACGFHASDPLSMDRAVRLAARHGVALGAHPGFPDRVGRGLRLMHCAPEEVRADIIYQAAALKGLAKAAGKTLSHLKPHGALYGLASVNQETAIAVAEAVADLDPELILVVQAGPGGLTAQQAGMQLGLRVAHEAYADRAYRNEGGLVPLQRAGSVIQEPEEIIARCVELATRGTVTAVDGATIELNPHTICLHEHGEAAPQLAAAIRQALEAAGVELSPMADLV